MRRPFGFFIAAATIALWGFPLLAAAPGTQPAGDQSAVAATGQGGAGAGQPTGTAGQEQAPQKVTFTGDVVLWAFTVHPDKTGDYEQVLAKLKAALTKLARPETQRQMAGWKIIKNSAAQPDGSILYIHVIDPVVSGADYSITNIVYEAFPDPQERIDFYELYRGSIKSAFFTIQAPLVNDLSR